MFIDTSFGKIVWGIFIAVCLAVAFQPIYAQGSGSIKGSVVDSETGEPVIGANVVIENTSLGVAADFNGEFYLRYVPAGKRTIKVSSLGYSAITKEIEIADGENLTNQVFRLFPHTITGEAVTVTAQARGQDIAINQQLASNTISNIVSADRIKELPDVSAAESIGRLPGISIDRYNGEATGVAIRGLAPKYNTVTVNGVALPATNNQDRSVDLSLVASNLLDGIEVKKANTPDMDADALGGTIDLRLKEAPEGYQLNGGLQGGYNSMFNKIGNYSANLSLSNRFFDNKLGVIAGVNFDRNNRNADKLTANYKSDADADVMTKVLLNTFTTRREEAFKDRLGGNLLMDYRLPNGKVAINGFYSQAKTDGTFRQDQEDFPNDKYYTILETSISTTSMYTSSMAIEQDFGWMKYDVSVSAVGSRTWVPDDDQLQFNQESATRGNGTPDLTMPLNNINHYITYDSTIGLYSATKNTTVLNEKTKVAQLNVEIPYKITDNLNGFLKTGAKLRWVARNFDQESWGRSGLRYGGFWTGAGGQVGKDLLTALVAKYPNDFDWKSDSTMIFNSNWLLSRFDTDHWSPGSDFLGGAYKMRMSPNLDLMKKIMSVFPTLTGIHDWQEQTVGSMGTDYDGIEEYYAAYFMTEIHVGSMITLTPGVRYDADYTKYHGETFKAVANAAVFSDPLDYQKNTNSRNNSFWLPMVHLKVVPFDWLRIHLAGTETVTRPDYNYYAPITSIDQYGSTLNAANAALRDSRSKNLDASISIYQKYFGYVAVSGFYKKIDDLIMYNGISTVNLPMALMLDSLGVNINAPLSWFKDPTKTTSTGQTPKVNTYINNAAPAYYRGVELEWQTNFWYLPSVLKGLVYTLNWTYINSQVDISRWLTTSTSKFDPIHHGWIITSVITHKIRSSRMPDQPAHIFNSTVGYDYKGFSVRLSYLYQSDKFSYAGESSIADAFTSPYERWDISAQQKITSNIQLYANFNNLTNTHDESLIGNNVNNPASEEYYGRSIDAGLRFNF
jgi:TonB-dependent receptor